MFLEAAVLGSAAGWFRKGRLKQLGNVPLKSLPLVLSAFLIQICLFVDFNWFGYLSALTPYLHIFSYLPLLAFILLNGRLPGMMLLGLGLLLNLAVIAANGGAMPVALETLSIEDQQELLAGTSSPFHRALTEETRLYFLGDIIRLPYGNDKIISVGDIALAVGLFWFVYQGMLYRSKESDD